ncbi:MAG: DnaJ domain-containing protein [Leptospiraceae bacterium]|nr:DnaJ domain-containing protein [Leptospiraceae bacterium]
MNDFSKEEKNIPDFYKSLRLPFGASSELVKKQYKKLAKIFHPDNQATGSGENFIQIYYAYKVLINEKKRKIYDEYYLKKFSFLYKVNKSLNQTKILLNEKRIVFPNSISTLAKHGLLRVGLRTKDRKKYSGINHDVEILIDKKEIYRGIIAKIPLTVRILCPECLGSDIYCESCNGKGNYKGTRTLILELEPEMIAHGKVFELELGRLRPDKFVHFKKKILKVKLEIITE